MLAGGEGRRLRPYTTILPKPLLPVGDRPILEIILRQLARDGFKEVVLAVGYLAELIEAYVGNGARFGIRVRYARESDKLGTAGPLAHIKNLPDPVLVMNGDVLTDLDYSRILRHHRDSEADATIGVIRRTFNIEFGVVETGKDGTITSFTEKPEITHLISTGINVLSAEAISRIPGDSLFDIPMLIRDLLNSGRRVTTYEIEGSWLDIGRQSDYERALSEYETDPVRFLPGREA